MEAAAPVANGNQILTMVGGIQVVVPKEIRHLTTFVLKEQGDWFEQEIKFLRGVIKPGMNVIDIGANYGMYTLTFARGIGHDGHLWAFEPAQTTADLLRQSIDLNKFNNVTLLQKGLSDREGEATFYHSPNSELNTLHPTDKSVPTETISLTTVDQCMKQYKWPDIDFIKLDAEGEESKILDGSSNLLNSMSPLIMFELKHAKQVNLPLIEQFGKIGYQTYRLMPGVKTLVPFDPKQPHDSYLLNLFCCKPDRARKLADEGVLIEAFEPLEVSVKGAGRSYISSLPYSKLVVEDADDTVDHQVEDMLDYYVTSMLQKVDQGQRVACLMKALQISTALTRRGVSSEICPIEIAASHARIAHDAGMRQRGVSILLQAISSNQGVTRLQLKLPFLPARKRYDRIDPGNRLNRWLVSSVVELWVMDHAFSSYFTAGKALPALQRLTTLGFVNPAIRRRYNLVSKLKLK